jgi:hypothetical protein
MVRQRYAYSSRQSPGVKVFTRSKPRKLMVIYSPQMKSGGLGNFGD